MPIHTLLADVTEGQGGFSLLLKVLNRLGVCTSADTLSRCIQHKLHNINPYHQLVTDTFTIFSADNIHLIFFTVSRMLKGNQNSSWHGTSIQAVQPLYSPLKETNSPLPTKSCRMSTGSEQTKVMQSF
jgi:hypothetical protein